jgi:ABC-type nitrate/sulfonate/bicarbonate transport system substrate-binding protein
MACARGAAPTQGGASSSTAPGAAPSNVAPTAALVPIKIAFSQVAAAFAPIWIAREHGYLKKYGLDAEVVNLQKPSDIQALISGDVQITVDGSAAVEAIAGGANLTYIAVPLPVYTQAVYGQPPLQTLGDLVGKTVGATSQGGSSDNALRTLLAREGIDASQLNITYLRDDAGILAALQTGAVQAAILTSPNMLRAREAGLREIVDMTPLKLRTINTGIIVRKDWAQQHPELVESFLKAYMEASHEAKTQPEGTKALISKRTQLDDQAMLEEAYQNSAAAWVVYPMPRDADIQNVIDRSAGAEARAHPPSYYYDGSYLQRLESFARNLDPASVAAAQ